MNKSIKKWLGPVAGMIVLAIFIVSVVDGAIELKDDRKIAELEAKKVTSISEIKAPEVPDVKPTSKTGVITAAEWASYYPNEYESHKLNENNVGSKDGKRHAYTEDTPNIQTLYKGMAFSFDYTEAVGHSYTLEDISKTQRPHKLANCLTCKTPDLTALVNSLGTEVYAKTFDEVFAQVSEPVSCYNCHENTPGTIVITADYMRDAMGDEIEAGKVDPVNVSCAQCHIEYYFDPQTKATKVPYDSLENMNPDSILAFYNEMGFKDYIDTDKGGLTGVAQIKVQHPEFEMYLGKGSIHKGTYNCADCHMSFDYDEEGDPYVDHEFTSPLDNQQLIDTTCSQCHKDIAMTVKAIQADTVELENKVSDKLMELNKKLSDAIENKTIDEEKANEVRAIYRDAQFYWDFVYVENSEGAHNSALAESCLNKAMSLAKKALELF